MARSSSLTLVFPHQLFEEHPAAAKRRAILVVEDSLFFGDSVPDSSFAFHQAKLVFHRASMKAFADRHNAGYRDHRSGNEGRADHLVGELAAQGYQELHLCEVSDYLLERRLRRGAREHGVSLKWYPSPLFLSPPEFLEGHFTEGKKPFMATFYQEQRKRMDVLMEPDGSPVGGKWSYDADNRKKLPKKITVPTEPVPVVSDPVILEEAQEYVAANFSKNPGRADGMQYPVCPESARTWLQTFLEERFEQFGDYEDAISREHRVAFHSVLTPMLNVGLLTPQEITDAILDYGKAREIPLNSLEGFVRQIIGWREFMHALYQRDGVSMRTSNFWEFENPMPAAFYDGTTGIPPIDDTIRRVLDTAYCHHIERLMVLGAFMLLCEIHPKAVYRWFMELFIDAYDWVMVPNVYGMSQFADGGGFTTKPYICGSNYIRKMSDYPKGDWCPIWDGLYWRFIHKHADFFRSNHRLSMMPRLLDKMAPEKLEAHLRNAEEFLAQIHSKD